MRSIDTSPSSSRLSRAIPTMSTLAFVAMLAGCNPGPTEQPATHEPPTHPMAVKTPPPLYPAELACAGIAGQVGVLLTIDADGNPKNVRVEDGSGHPQLDQAAIEAVKGWKFQAGTSRGKPTESPLRVPVTFAAPDMDSERCEGVSSDRLTE